MADTPTHFFKFIRPSSNLDLSIPRAFLRHLNCTRRCSKAIIRRGGHEWLVDITDDGRFSGHGWKKCVKENGVKEFDFVVFEHLGNMVFNFLVFDPSQCERKYPNPSANIIDLIDSESDEEEEESILGVKKEKKSIIKKATTPSTSNDYPYFTSTLKACSLTMSIMYLPIDFVESNGLKVGKGILKDDESRLWEVQLKQIRERKFYIGSGLREFVIGNELKEGDAFKFEVVKNQKNKPPVINFLCKSYTPMEDDQERPYFIGKLKSYGVGTSSFLYLLTPFAKKHGLFCNEKMILTNDKDERSWNVKLKNHTNRYCYIGRGWRAFCVANGLKEGDRYKFEIVNNIDVIVVVKFYIL